MKTSLRTQIFVIAIMAASTTANAQRIPFACQGEIVGGLAWKSDRWVVSKFYEDKFILVQDGALLTVESVSKVLGGPDTTCQVLARARITCTDGFGGYLFFDPQSRRGTVAQLYGGTIETTEKRDTITVEPFSCQEF